MTPRAWTRRLIEIVLGLLIAAAAIWCMQQTVLGQGYARFHRYTLTRLDDRTSIDMIKDTATRRCYAVYLRGSERAHSIDTSATLGEVPCDPAPVPLASAVK